MNAARILLLLSMLGVASARAGDLADARVALDAKRPKAAERLLRAAVLDPSTRVEALLIWGELARASGRPELSRSIFRAVLRIDEGNRAARDGLRVLASRWAGPFVGGRNVAVARVVAGTIASGDVDGDGWFDVVEGDAKGLWLRRNDGPPDFELMPRVALRRPHEGKANAIALADVDLDGNLDLIVAGRTSSGLALGDGAGGFKPVGGRFPGATALRVADSDGDGDIDLVLQVSGTGAAFRNATGPGPRRLDLLLVGDSGARVTVETGSMRLVRDDARLPIGLGWTATRVDIEIKWSSGTRQVHLGLPVGRWRIEEGAAPVRAER